MPTKEEALRVLRILRLPIESAAVCGGALLAEHEIRDNLQDIDLLVTKELFDKIKGLWREYLHGSDDEIETPFVCIDGVTVEAFPSIDFVDYEKAQEYISRADIRHGIRFVRLEDMLAWKQLIIETRPKNKKNIIHKADIELIKYRLGVA